MDGTPVEDCLRLIPNRFELCSIASKRARQLARGATSTLPETGHKSTTQALNEIATGDITRAVLIEPDLSLPAHATTFGPLDPFEI